MKVSEHRFSLLLSFMVISLGVAAYLAKATFAAAQDEVPLGDVTDEEYQITDEGYQMPMTVSSNDEGSDFDPDFNFYGITWDDSFSTQDREVLQSYVDRMRSDKHAADRRAWITEKCQLDQSAYLGEVIHVAKVASVHGATIVKTSVCPKFRFNGRNTFLALGFDETWTFGEFEDVDLGAVVDRKLPDALILME